MADDKPASSAPEPSVSSIRIPITIAHETLAGFANVSVETSVQGGNQLGNFGPASGNSIRWSLSRTPIAVSGADGRLTVSTAVNGSVTVAGSIKPIRGDIGKLLGRANPSQPYSQTADVGASLTVSAAPELHTDWSIEPNLQASANVHEASARIMGLFDISFRSELQGPLDEAVTKERDKLSELIRSDQSLRNEAMKAWTELCRPIPVVVGDGLPDLSLRIEPKVFAATQPVINAGGVSVELGLEAFVRLTSAGEASGECPPFNETLALAAAPDGGVTISLQAKLDYRSINTALEKVRAANPVVSAPGVEAQLSRVTLSPLGSSLLVTVEGRFAETRFFGAGANGTLYLAVSPELDETEQTVTLRGATLHVESREALLKVAAALSSLLGPAIEARIAAVSFDLKPEIEKLRGDVNKAAEALRTQSGPTRASEAMLDSIALGALWHDETGVHVTVQATGRVALEALAIAPR